MHVKKEVATYEDLTRWYDAQYRANGTWESNGQYTQVLIDLLRQAGLTAANRKTLLDIACGGAFFLEYSQASFKQVFGCDISRVGLDEARARCPQLKLCEANGEFLPFHNQAFDIVTCLGSLEHFLNPSQALVEMRRILKPGGIIMILVPINPDWAVYDIQPTEIVMDPPEWEKTFQRAGLQTLVTIATDQFAALKASSGGCQVYCLQPTAGSVLASTRVAT
jgi:ubiquinone/menaquinone biosynthesis C-methylase UbiE